MKPIARVISALLCVGLLFGCSKDEPKIFDLIHLYQQGQYDQAITLAEKLIADNPNDAEAHRFLIKSAVAKGESEQYLNKYLDLTKSKPNVAGYHFGLGYLYTQTQKFEQSIPELEKAIQLDPNIDFARYSLGWVYIFAKFPGQDAKKGLTYWKEEEQLNPKSMGALQVYSDRADYYLRNGDADAAEKDYEKITMYAFAQGDISGARTLISRIRTLRDELARLEAEAKEKPDDPEVQYELGVLQYKNGKVKEAIETWTGAVALDPNNAQLRNFLGKALLEQARFAEAIPHLEKAAELDQTITTVYYNLGVAEESVGNTAKALEDYKKYVEMNPMAPRLDDVKKKISELESAQSAGKEG